MRMPASGQGRLKEILPTHRAAIAPCTVGVSPADARPRPADCCLSQEQMELMARVRFPYEDRTVGAVPREPLRVPASSRSKPDRSASSAKSKRALAVSSPASWAAVTSRG